jgi:primosomal protein N' (replication factor Y)
LPCRVGQRVCVPLGKGFRCGLIWGIDPAGADVPEVKPVLWPLESSPLLSPDYLEFIHALAVRYAVSPGRVLGSVLPKNLRSINLQLRTQADGLPNRFPLTAIAGLSPKQLERLARSWREGSVSLGPVRSEQGSPVFVVTQDPPWPLRPHAKRQWRLVEQLWENGPQSLEQLRRSCGPGVQDSLRRVEALGVIRRCSAGDIVQRPETAGLGEAGPNLSPEQQQAFEALYQELISDKPGFRLLFGITGSGKTLLYLHLIRACLAAGRFALCLAPEVALAWRIWTQAVAFLGRQACVLYHGSQTAVEREQAFTHLAARTEPCLVVGTRSAVFLPGNDWGLIILDEEHDASFKQEERFGYQAREAAFYLTRHSRGLLLLGSATPDMKTFYAARDQKAPVIRLPNRVGGGCLPAVEIVPLPAKKLDTPLHPDVGRDLFACLERGEQAIVLLNRRGYAPLVYCTACSQVVKCGQCDVGMTFHKNRERLICHYCGQSRPFPLPCPECGGHQYVPLDEGTEQVEEYLQARLDREIGILRLDRDTTKRKGSLESILDRFAQHKAQLLIGTQMCSKGHHFPEVTRVVVLDGDIGLNLPDYRATERTFQLLVQVAGRAGRGEKPGKVLIQTRNPGHYCWRYIAANDYEGFYEQEIELRKRFRYPPFVKLALLRLDFPVQEPRGEELIRETAGRLRDRARQTDMEILGPAPAPLRILRGRKRYHCLIKAADWSQIRALCSPELSDWSARSPLRVSLDLDPVQML